MHSTCSLKHGDPQGEYRLAGSPAFLSVPVHELVYIHTDTSKTEGAGEPTICPIAIGSHVRDGIEANVENDGSITVHLTVQHYNNALEGMVDGIRRQ